MLAVISLKDEAGKIVIFTGDVSKKEDIEGMIDCAAMGKANPDGYMRVKPVQDLAPETGEVSDIANTALFLASDDSRYISGAIIKVDGGWTAF